MALKLNIKKETPAVNVPEAPDAPTTQSMSPATQVEAPALKPPSAPTPKPPKPSWLRSGAAAHEVYQGEQARQQEIQKSIADGKSLFTPRFWLRDGDSASIVFLDGNLIGEGKYAGNLDYINVWEHTVEVGVKRWDSFICCAERQEPCPLCDQMGDKPSLTAMFSVIDLRKIPSKKNPGVFFENEVKLYPAKQQTLGQLQKLAAKRGGLRGCVFDVSRHGQQSPRVGSMFDFQMRLSEEDLVSKFPDRHVPLDYEHALRYRSPAEISALVGLSPQAVVGAKGYSPSSGASSNSLGPPDDDVPF